MTKITSVLLTVLLVCCWGRGSAADNTSLYKVTLVQAAPGKLLELIDLYKTQAAALASCAPATTAGGPGADSARGVISLNRISTLRTLFNRDAGRTRLILILSPT